MNFSEKSPANHAEERSRKTITTFDRLKQQPARLMWLTRLTCIFLGCFALGASLPTAGATAAAAPSSVKLAWDASPDAAVTGYCINYGAAPGQYTNTIVVGNVTSNVVAGLVNGVTYYFAITAYNAGGAQSQFSNEISYTAAYSRLRMKITPSRQFILTIDGPSSHSYAIEATQNLSTWTVIGTATPGAGGSVDFTDVNAAGLLNRFYRLRDTTP